MKKNSSKKITPSYGTLVFWVLLCAVGIVASSILYLKIKTINEGIATTQDKISATLDQAQRLKGEEEFAKSIKPFEDRVMNTIVDLDAIDEFTGVFDTFEARTGAKVEIANITPVESGAEELLLDRVNIDVTFTGNWQQVVHAIALIEAMPYAGKVDTMTLQSVETVVGTGKTDQKTYKWQGTLSYKALTFKEAK